jgi:hypothetical protein
VELAREVAELTQDSFLVVRLGARARSLAEGSLEIFQGRNYYNHFDRFLATVETAMKRSGSGRVARKIGSYEGDDDSAKSAESSSNEVKKPIGQSKFTAFSACVLTPIGMTS